MIRFRSLLSSLVLVSASLLASCKDDVTPGQPPSAPPSIKVGVILGQKGSSQQSAADILTGIRTAEYQVNAQGGIDGRPVELIVRDDRDDDKDGIVAIATELIDQGVIGILGPVRSKQVVALGPLVTERQVPMLSASATAVNLAEQNAGGDPFVFRIIPNDDLQVKAMVKLAADGLGGSAGGCTKMAVVHADDDYGNGFDVSLARDFPKSGSGRTMGPRLPLDEEAASDYDAVISQLAAARPTCLAVIAVQDVGGKFVAALANARVANATLFPEGFFVVTADGLYNKGFLDASKVGSAIRAEGVFGTVAAAPVGWSPLEDFLVLYDQVAPGATADTLTSYVANGYDAAMLLLLGRAYAGSDVPVDVRNAMLEMSRPTGDLVGPAEVPGALVSAADGIDFNYNGASGPVDIQDATGDVLSGFRVWTVAGGKFVTLGNYSLQELAP